jgi:hypothetical protein
MHDPDTNTLTNVFLPNGQWLRYVPFIFLYFFWSCHDNMLEKIVFRHRLLLCLQYLYQWKMPDTNG